MHKSGFINILGNPNVGKSTLMNCLVGENLSIITPKVQTTRHRILGILNNANYQLIFSDTPGIIEPKYELQSSMMDFVKNSFDDADIIIYMVEVGDRLKNNADIHNRLLKLKIPLIILLNKIDLTNQTNLENEADYWSTKFPNAEIFSISALNNFNIESLLQRLIDLTPKSPKYFPDDQMTDKSERFFVNEKIREKILMYYSKEIPYSVEVLTSEFKNEEKIIKIRSQILVERESQKAIIIGHKGNALRKIGTKSRKDLELFFDKKIFLDLHVKVLKNWRSDPKLLKKFGYKN
jgi:GTP-binding protein Era|tara:strand:+ start:492 stop:1370 length:879 start_codon:yes stop_codon:yes gene_type:complete